jgi:putative FmdB family regulatory protein
MPIYEYVCTDCDHKFELIRPVSKSSEAASCPNCHKPAERVLSRFACFTTDDSGMPMSLAGNSCDGCSADDCSSCNM